MLKLTLLIALVVSIHGYPTATWPTSQFHTQEPSGSYQYGYSSPHHAKMETRVNGVTQGGYSYIDANGILQTVAYTADDVNGFRIRGSNLPKSVENSVIKDNEGLKIVRRKYLDDYEKFGNSIGDSNGDVRDNQFLLSSGEAASIKVPRPYLRNGDGVNYSPGNLQTTGGYVPIVPWRLTHSAMHHTQDSLGQYDYSYAGDTSAKTESRSLDGTTRGAYSYIDANGLLQQVHYIADHNGFRVLATNLPEA